MQYLQNAHNIILYNCVNITDDGIKHLKNVRNININGVVII